MSQRRRAWWGVGGLAAVGITALIFLLPAATQPRLDDAHDPVLGSSNALVTIYYFADFQCPFCREFELGGLDGLRADFIETSEVRLVFKDLAILGDDSWTAAQASQHVWTTTPDLYWTWHRAIFEAQGAERDGWARAENLVALSANVEGIDAEGMSSALADARYLEEARDDQAQGNAAGVRGTPSLVIDGRVYNALADADVRAAIAEALP